MKRFIAKMLVIVMLAAVFFVPTSTLTAKETGDTKSRAIYVVFDNSGSMYMEGNKAWSQATYAMEVFAAMMNFDNGDVMKIFPMHNVTTQGENGEVSSMTISSQADIAKIHHMYTPEPLGTPYAQVSTASAELKQVISSKQKDEGWLIVLTDGEFNTGVPQVGVEADLKSISDKKQNIYVQYLAIGEEVQLVPKSEPSDGFYSQKAVNSSQVVDELAVICNRIFKRNEYTSYESGKDLEFDIPVGKIIIFAQGEKVKINGLKSSEGDSINKQNSVSVSYSATDGGGLTASVKKTPVKDTTLKGEVAVFADKASSIVAGKYKLDVTGAESIKIYYEPDVKFGVGLFDEDGEVTKEQIEGGNYTLYIGFVDRVTGKFITESTLLGTPTYTLKINGEDVEVEAGKASQGIPLGVDGETLEIEAAVTYLDNYTDSDSISFKVCTLDLEAKAPSSMALKSLEDSSNAITITAMKNGKDLTEEQWDSAKVNIRTLNAEGKDANIEWDIKKGDKVSTWILTPKYKDGDMFKTDIGKLNISIDVSTEIDGTAYGSAKAVDIEVEDDRTIADYLQRYWKELLICLAILVLILGYVPPFKKYFSLRMKKRPSIECSAEKIGIHDMLVKGTFKKDILSTLIPYKPETGRLTFSPAPVKKSAKLRATGGSGMVILNTSAFAGKDNITFNGMSIPDNYKGNYRISASTIINVSTPEFTYECIPNVQKSADGSIKRNKKRR